MRNKRLPATLNHWWIVLVVAFMLLVSGWVQTTSAQAADEKAPDKIRIGCAIALSGPNAIGGITTQVNPYKLWVADTNKRADLCPKYNKRFRRPHYLR